MVCIFCLQIHPQRTKELIKFLQKSWTIPARTDETNMPFRRDDPILFAVWYSTLNQKTLREYLEWSDISIYVLVSGLPLTTLYSAITIPDHTHIGPVLLHMINPAPSLNYQSIHISQSSYSQIWELQDSIMASWYRLLFARCSPPFLCNIYPFRYSACDIVSFGSMPALLIDQIMYVEGLLGIPRLMYIIDAPLNQSMRV